MVPPHFDKHRSAALKGRRAHLILWLVLIAFVGGRATTASPGVPAWLLLLFEPPKAGPRATHAAHLHPPTQAGARRIFWAKSGFQRRGEGARPRHARRAKISYHKGAVQKKAAATAPPYIATKQDATGRQF